MARNRNVAALRWGIVWSASRACRVCLARTTGVVVVRVQQSEGSADD